VTKDELEKLQAYLRRLFGNQAITVRGRPRKEDSAELFVGDEFVGVVFRDDEEGEVSYNLSMAILAYDLDAEPR
jgi:hypothetical protein